MSIGQIVQVIGAVVDIEFPRDDMPKVYDALVLEEDKSNTLAEAGLTFEVQQQLGDGVVRTIAMGSSDGLQRGMKVKSTGAGISVPVGHKTLGRLWTCWAARSMTAAPSAKMSAVRFTVQLRSSTN